MTTIANIVLPIADSWTVSVGGGWIVVMLIGMGLCFVGMFAFMSFMRGGQGWRFCGWRRPLSLDDERRAVLTGTALPRIDQNITSAESRRSNA